MMIDLDRFKEINDTLGHTTGDLLLRAIGPRLREALRGRATRSPASAATSSRSCSPRRSTTRASGRRRRVLASAREPLDARRLARRRSTRASASSLYPSTATTPRRCCSTPTSRCTRAKTHAAGEALYDAAHDPHYAARLDARADLRRAIADDEFELHYQPKFDTATREPRLGVEALVRWRHPERGLRRTRTTFIPLAEHTGLIKPLTPLVLDKRDATSRAAGATQGIDLPVAVNLSVAQPARPRRSSTTSPRLLERESVPRVAARSSRSPRARSWPTRSARTHVLGTLSRDGRELSRRRLRHRLTPRSRTSDDLPVDELKIDKSFVRHLAVDEDDAAIVRSTVDLGHELGLTRRRRGGRGRARARVAEEARLRSRPGLPSLPAASRSRVERASQVARADLISPGLALAQL